MLFNLVMLFALATASGALNTICLKTPIGFIHEPCGLRNLTVVSSITGSVLANQTTCNGTVPITSLRSQPKVYFTNFNSTQYSHSRFILLAFDATVNHLLWAVSNISTHNTPFLIPSQYSKASILKQYEVVNVNPSRRIHNLIFMVFEEKPNYLNVPVVVSLNDVMSFNLSQWLSQQIDSGRKICGPVAATQLSVYNESQHEIQPHSIKLPETKVQPHSSYSSSSQSPSLQPQSQSHPTLSDSYSQSPPTYISNTQTSSSHSQSPPHSQPHPNLRSSLQSQNNSDEYRHTSTPYNSFPHLQTTNTHQKEKVRNAGINSKANLLAVIFVVIFFTFSMNS